MHYIYSLWKSVWLRLNYNVENNINMRVCMRKFHSVLWLISQQITGEKILIASSVHKCHHFTEQKDRKHLAIRCFHHLLWHQTLSYLQLNVCRTWQLSTVMLTHGHFVSSTCLMRSFFAFITRSLLLMLSFMAFSEQNKHRKFSFWYEFLVVVT